MQNLYGEVDLARRRSFCRWALRRHRQDHNFHQRILFTDECRFGRDGAWNFHNEHYWSETNLFEVMLRAFQVRFSVHLWAGIVDGKVIGPYQLPPRLNGATYNEFLRVYLPPLLAAEGIQVDRIVFMPDGHPAHYTRRNLFHLRNIFGDRVISLCSEVEWPPRLPDLNPLDFFFWGHLKSQIYRNPLENIQQLHQRLRDALATVTPEMLERTTKNFINRLRWCRRRRGIILNPGCRKV